MMQLLFFAYVRPTPQEPLSRAPLLYKQTLEHADGRQAKVSCIRIGVCALFVTTVVVQCTCYNCCDEDGSDFSR